VRLDRSPQPGIHITELVAAEERLEIRRHGGNARPGRAGGGGPEAMRHPVVTASGSGRR
jgi:hypothetical protein